MKKIVFWGFILAICMLCSCGKASDREEYDSKKTENVGNTEGDTLTESVENTASVVNNGVFVLPISNKTIKLDERYSEFAPYITVELLEAAEKNIEEWLDGRGSSYLYLSTDSEGYLNLEVEIIEFVNMEKVRKGEIDPFYGGDDHRHRFYGERISTVSLDKFVRDFRMPSKWRDGFTITNLVNAIIESSADPISERPDVDEDGTFDLQAPGGKTPLEYLRRADESINGESLTVALAGLEDTIIVYYRADDPSNERTVIITPSVMLVLKTSFQTPEWFAYDLYEPITPKVISSKIIHKTDDHGYCLQSYNIFKIINQEGVIEELPELDYDSDVYYAFYNGEEFEIFSDKMWERIYPDEDVPVGELFKRTYERFGVSELIFGE